MITQYDILSLLFNFLACFLKGSFFTKIFRALFFQFSQWPFQSFDIKIILICSTQWIIIHFLYFILTGLTGFMCDLSSIQISLSLTSWNSAFPIIDFELIWITLFIAINSILKNIRIYIIQWLRKDWSAELWSLWVMTALFLFFFFTVFKIYF